MRPRLYRTDCIGNLPRCTLQHKKTRSITLFRMENTDHLLLRPDVLFHLLFGLPLMMAALDALHHFDLVFTPKRPAYP
jgi:hypothetical protein